MIRNNRNVAASQIYPVIVLSIKTTILTFHQKKKQSEKTIAKKNHKTFSKLEMISGCSILMVF